jgi:predicted DCC family thiol-disulfide oxidoreductase YuxK
MDELNIPEHKIIILFDGVCNLCNSSVLFVIKRDKKDVFRYAPLQGALGHTILKYFEIDPSKMDSIITYNPSTNHVHFKSDAALNIASQLGFPYNLLKVFKLIPLSIRNWIYDLVARNRYKWFGKKRFLYDPNTRITI